MKTSMIALGLISLVLSFPRLSEAAQQALVTGTSVSGGAKTIQYGRRENVPLVS